MHEDSLKTSHNNQERSLLAKEREFAPAPETDSEQLALSARESAKGMSAPAIERGNIGIDGVRGYIGAETSDIEEAQAAIASSDGEIRSAEAVFQERIFMFAETEKSELIDMEKSIKIPDAVSEKFELQEVLPEETAEEYLTRFDNSLHEWSDSNNPQPAAKVFLRKHGQSLKNVTNNFLGQDKQNAQRLIEILKRALKNDDIRQSIGKDAEMTEVISKKIGEANRDAATGDTDERRGYYGKTNQKRLFFTDGRKNDNHAYAKMLFGIPEPVTETEAGKEYWHGILDGKVICLLGGGDSINDLLQSEYSPKNVINFDPYVTSETVEKNESRRYQSLPISAADSRITEMVGRGEIPKADEIWASYSVPFYLTSPEEIKALVSNISELLADGGNARISPIAVQGEGSLRLNGGTFDEMRLAFLDAITGLMTRSDINVTLFGASIKIHKIKGGSDESLAFVQGE